MKTDKKILSKLKAMSKLDNYCWGAEVEIDEVFDVGRLRASSTERDDQEAARMGRGWSCRI